MKNFIRLRYRIYFIIRGVLIWWLQNFQESTLLFFFCFFKSHSFRVNIFDFLIRVDWVSCLFLIVLFLISGSVGKFSVYYMERDSKKIRFFWILNLFVLSMVILLLVPHFVFFLLGWDGLGFTRFLLIKYYRSRNACGSSL